MKNILVNMAERMENLGGIVGLGIYKLSCDSCGLEPSRVQYELILAPDGQIAKNRSRICDPCIEKRFMSSFGEGGEI
ncbi:MAG TPA: hypothetical protein VLE91_01200 [Candidatus Saccharimonadales bacterium]|nr:hypothetical protein [Candidatus Saccharimonadales bacterium]